MAEELISQYIDQAAIKAQTDFFLKQLEQLDKAYNDLNNKQITVKGANNTKDFVASIKEMEAATKQAAKSQDDFAKSVVIAEKAQQAKIRTDQEALKQIALQEKAEQERLKTAKLAEQQADRNAKAAEREAAARVKAAEAAQASAEVPFTHNLTPEGTPIQPGVSGAATAVNELDKAQQAAANSATAMGNAQLTASNAVASSVLIDKELVAAQEALVKANSERNVVLQGYKLQQTEANKAAREEAAIQLGIDTPAQLNRKKQMLAIEKAERDEMLAIEKEVARQSAIKERAAIVEEKNTKDLANDYKQLSIAYSEAALRAKNLALQMGSDAPAAKAAAAEANALGAKLKEVDASTGAFQRNVGNYGNAITGAFSKAFGFIRQIAYVLPGIGVAGIIGAVSDVVIELVTSLVKGTNALNTFAENYKNFNEVATNANKEAGKQTADLKILYATATDVNQSMADRLDAVRALQKEFPDYFKNITAENILNGNAASAYKEVAASIVEVARATAAKAKIDELEAQRLDIAFQKQKINAAVNKENARATNTSAGSIATGSGFSSPTTGISKEEEIKFNELRRVKALREQDLKDQSLEQQEAFLIAFVGQKAITKVTEDGIKDRHDKTKKAAQTETDILKELRKELNTLAQEEKIGQITPKDADIDRVKAYDKAFKSLFDIGKTAITPIVQKLVVEVEPIDKRVLEAKIHDLVSKIKPDTTQIAPPVIDDKAQRDLIIKNTSDQVQKITDMEKAGYVHDLENLKSYLDAGYITEKEYNDRVKALKEDHGRSEMDNTIALTEAIIENLKARSDGSKEATDQIAGYERQLNDLKAKLYEQDVKNNEEADKKKAEAERKHQKDLDLLAKAQADQRKLEVDLAKEAVTLLETLVTASIENQIRAVQTLEATQQKNYDQQVQRINDSTLTEEQKAEKLKLLEQQRQAQKEQNDAKERDLNIKRAKFDRLENVAKIIASTATAEVQALTYLSNPITAPLYPGIAALIAGIGAIQLATLLATPLPKYEKGTEGHKGGPFIWGEAGTELAIEPSGKTYLSPDTATLGYAPAGTKIISNKDLVKYTQTFSTKATDKVLSNASYGQSELAGLFKENTRELRNVHKAIKGLPQPKININAKHDPSFQIWVNKNVRGKR